MGTPGPLADLATLAFWGAHAALVAASLFLLLEPAAVLLPWTHPQLVGLIHLLTQGWILGSALAAVSLFGPGAFQLGPLPRRPLFGLLLFWSGGTTFFAVGHFLGVPALRALAGATLGLALGAAGLGLTFRSLQGSKSSAVVRFGFGVSGFLLAIMAVLGGWVAVSGFPVAESVLKAPPGCRAAHVYLAVFGWTGTLLGVAGSRMLPMLLATPLPTPRHVFLITAGFAGGAVAVVAGLLEGSRLAGSIGRLTLAATTWVFLTVHLAALRRRHRPSKQLQRPDAGMFLAIFGLVLLAVAGGVGLGELLSEARSGSLRAAPLTPTPALVLFLTGASSLVAAVWNRFAPYLAWQQERRKLGGEPPRVGPEAGSRFSLRWGAAIAWVLGVGGLLAGSWWNQLTVLRWSGAALLAFGLGSTTSWFLSRRAVGNPSE